MDHQKQRGCRRAQQFKDYADMIGPTVTMSKYHTSCDHCLTSKVKCSRTKPVCGRCSQSGQRCVYSPFRRIGRPPKMSTWNPTVQQQPEVTNLAQKQQRQRQQQTQQDQEERQQGDLVGNKADNAAVNVSNANLSTQMTATATPEEMDLSLTLGTPWPSGQAAPQGQPPGADDVARVLEGIPDLDSFDFELPANNFGELDIFLDATAGPLPSPGTSPACTIPKLLIPFSCWDSAVFAHAPPPPSSDCSSQSAPSRSSAADSGTMSGQSQPTMLVPEQLSTSNSQSVSGISTSHSHSNHPLRANSHPYQEVGNPPLSTTSRRRTGFERYPSLSQVTPRRSIASSHGRALSVNTGIGRLPPRSSLDGQCSNKCYAALAEQLARLSGCGSDGCAIPLDLLLSLDRDVYQEKDKALNCASCLGKTSSRPTLTLVIMVLEHLLGLFEKEYDADLAAELDGVIMDRVASWRRVHGSDMGSCRQRADRSGSTLPLLHRDKPLLVGDFEVEEDVKAAFLRQLLRLHLDRLMITLSELDKALDVGLKDVNYRIAREMLVDIHRRILFLQGLLALTE